MIKFGFYIWKEKLRERERQRERDRERQHALHRLTFQRDILFFETGPNQKFLHIGRSNR